MLKSFNNLINDKLKCLQQQLRAKDERILALETENAMLYLKLAQREGTVRNLQDETSHRKRLLEDGDREKAAMKAQMKNMRRNMQELRSLFEQLKKEIGELPFHLNAKSMLQSEQQESSIKMLLNNFNDQNVNNINLQNKLLVAEASLNEAVRKVNEERSRRRTLHNALMELRGNIRVFCRVRPLLAQLDSYGEPDLLGLPGTQSEQIIDVVDEENILFKQKSHGMNSGGVKTKSFEFERIFSHEHNQENVYQEIEPLLTSLLDGYNVCIMAYGQTGSGKTHTMLGDHSLDSDFIDDGEPDETKEGVIPRSAKTLFGLIYERETASEKFIVEVSVFEIYNNEIRDLLGFPTDEVKHAVFSASDGSQEIPTLTTRRIHTANELMSFVRYGLEHRHEDRTQVHDHSSRSHLIVQLNIYQHKQPENKLAVPFAASFDQRELTAKLSPANNTRTRSRSPALPSPKSSKSGLPVSTRKTSRSLKPTVITKSKQSTPSSSPPRSTSPPLPQNPKLAIKTKLQLVDLAGSECVGLSGVTGAAFRETSNINKSLSALADVLQALAENQTHVPYRNTKLTHVLQDTIGGDSKLVVMLCVSPAQKYGVESLQCLGFGSRARQIARGQVKKRRATGYNLSIDPVAVQRSPVQRSISAVATVRR